MPQPRNTPAADPAAAPSVAQKGDHNPYLAGLLEQGAAANEAIKGWYDTRKAIRDQARGVVKTGLCTDDQAAAVEAMFPTPKKGEKEDAEPSNGAAS